MKDHLDLLDLVRYVDAELGRDDRGIGRSELLGRLCLGRAALHDNEMHWAGAIVELRDELVVVKEWLADELAGRRDAHRAGHGADPE